MKTLEFKWTVSRGRDTYGYNICSLYVDGQKVSACNGGGYDMKGTALGNWIARAYADRLLKLTPKKMPKQSHWEIAKLREITVFTCRECGQEWREERLEFHGCPVCSKKNADSEEILGNLGMNDGKTVNDGNYFYGLSFHDPDYDPGKAVIGMEKVTDRTLGKVSEGKTVEQAEEAGESLGLERYQAFYSASSKVPTKAHRIPLIDGACGLSSVEKIMAAIGLQLEYVPVKGMKIDIYRLIDGKEK
jgi:hypothetical protein